MRRGSWCENLSDVRRHADQNRNRRLCCPQCPALTVDRCTAFPTVRSPPRWKSPTARERLHTVTIVEGAYAIGHSLAELGLKESGALVTAVRRGGIRGPQPGPSTRLQAGDVPVPYGKPEDLENAEGILLRGNSSSESRIKAGGMERFRLRGLR